MLVLQGDNDSLQLITSAAISTDYNITYDDNPGSQLLSAQGNIATATTTTILAAPTARITRRVSDVFIRNKHASTTQTVTLIKTVSGTSYHVFPAVTLFAGESLSYTNSNGLQVFTATGRQKIANGSFISPQLLVCPEFQASDITSTRALGPGWCIASYMGKAPRNLEWVTVRARIATRSLSRCWRVVSGCYCQG